MGKRSIAKRSLFLLGLVANWLGALIIWQVCVRVFLAIFHLSDPVLTVSLALVTILSVFLLLHARLSQIKSSWVRLWLFTAPWCLSALSCLPFVSFSLVLPSLFGGWVFFGFWGAVRFAPLFRTPSGLHHARFAELDELAHLLHLLPVRDGLLLGRKTTKQCLCVRPQKHRRELGNLLIVGPTRSGKGLLATSQLLSWGHSVVVNDIKGDLFTQTAGYRSTLGPVYVIDPTGVGHHYDPLRGRHTEDSLYAIATRLLFDGEERDPIFTRRAINMLTQIFLAARAEEIAPLLYARCLMRLGLQEAVERLNVVNPELATQFLDSSFEEANFSDRFLVSSWGTLTAKMKPLLTETIVRSFLASDVDAQTLLCAEKPVTIYLRWPEQDMLSLSPLIRLLWGSLIDELLAVYDRVQGVGCQPVLLLVDEAGRTAIPMLADHATTVVGRGLSLWIAIQSLSQLEAVYGRARAQVLRDNMESQVYYRPTDLSTAHYLETRLGKQSGYAQSQTLREGEETSQGLSEQGVPLLAAQDILQLKDEDILGFHRGLPPFKLTRLDWRTHPVLTQRRSIAAPSLSSLPPLPDLSFSLRESALDHFVDETIDPDLVN